MKYFVLLFVLSLTLHAQNPTIVLPIGHSSGVMRSQFSPDGKFAITSSQEDLNIKVWDANTGYFLFDLKGSNNIILSIAYSPDGTKVLSSSFDGFVRVWDACNGVLLKTFPPISNLKVTIAKFSHDGEKLLLTNKNLTQIIKVSDWSLIFTFEEKEKLGRIPYNLIYFSNDNKCIITSNDSTVNIRNANTGNIETTYFFPKYRIKDAGISLNGKLFYTTLKDSSICVFNIDTGKQLIKLLSKSRLRKPLDFSQSKILVATNDNKIEVWDSKNWKLKYNISEEIDNIQDVKFSPDGSKILVCFNKYAKLLNTKNGQYIATFKGHKANINSIEFSKDSQRLITSSTDGTSKIWDTMNGEELISLRGHCEIINFVQFHPQQNNIVITSEGENANIWDIEKGELKGQLYGSGNFLVNCSYSPDGQYIATNGNNNLTKLFRSQNNELITTITHKNPIVNGIFNSSGSLFVTINRDSLPIVWETNSGKLLFTLVGHSDWVNTCLFSADGANLITASRDGTIKIWDVSSGKLIRDIKAHHKSINEIAYSHDGKLIVSVGDDTMVKIWDAKTGQGIHVLSGHTLAINSVQFSKNDSLIITASDDKTIKVWSIFNGKMIHDLKLNGHTGWIKAARFNNDCSKIVSFSNVEQVVKVWDTNTGILHFDLVSHSDGINAIAFDNNNRLCTVSNDNTSKLWDLDSGKLQLTFFALDKKDYFCQLPTGHYKCSQNASKTLHYKAEDNSVVSFEQLDIKFNRPDLVLRSLNIKDQESINLFQKAYLKRIESLKLDTTKFTSESYFLTGDFQNRNQISFEQKKKSILLHFKAESKYNLSNFRLWLNEIPIFGEKGIDLSSSKTNVLDTLLSIDLSNGKNLIEASVIDQNGMESFRKPLILNHKPRKQTKSKTWFIGIGIDSYADKKYNLSYCSKDIADLTETLKLKFGKKLIIDTLLNQSVTKESIKNLKKRLLKTHLEDKVIIAYSGHGIISKELDYFLATYNTKFENPKSEALPYEELENLLDNIPARKKLLLLDACHSGIIDKDQNLKSLSQTNIVTKGVPIAQVSQISNRNTKSAFEVMQDTFINVGKSTGATIIAASRGNEEAIEQDKLQNGVFTYTILESLKDTPNIKVSELKTIIAKRVIELTKGVQQPVIRSGNINFDWYLW